MKKHSLAGLLLLAMLVSGCPHNEYTVELTPRGSTIERKLTFYRADGVNSDGTPNYQSFPDSDLQAITALYPPGAVTNQGQRHIAHGDFSEAMPRDVGGAGAWKHFTNSLGSACLYAERFRGDDDLLGQQQKRLGVANQLTDLVIGWSRTQFGHEPGFKKLHRFLDGDFRRDLKNLALYCWTASASDNARSDEEPLARFSQYLFERGYFKIKDLPEAAALVSGRDDPQQFAVLQRLVAEKLDMPASKPLPSSLAIFDDPEALEKSWNKYVATSEIYHARVRQWEKEKQSKPEQKKPEASELTGELVVTLIGLGGSGEDDHLGVRLALPSEPEVTNGKWDADHKQVTWESKIEASEPFLRPPIFCYATWTEANERFQQDHFGRVIVTGADLLNYSLWQARLQATQVIEWEKFLADFRPDQNMSNRITGFKFTADLPQSAAMADAGKQLLQRAIGQGQ